ncbi:MAG: hypothetical protein WD065_18305, partial [Planctomycetaceae bacterium]
KLDSGLTRLYITGAKAQREYKTEVFLCAFAPLRDKSLLVSSVKILGCGQSPRHVPTPVDSSSRLADVAMPIVGRFCSRYNEAHGN